jgi:hypothetical protein
MQENRIGEVETEPQFKPIQETKFIAWNHPTGAEMTLNEAVNNEEVKAKLTLLMETTTPIVAFDGIAPHFFDPELGPGYEALNEVPEFNTALSILPDDTLFIAGDPIILNWVTEESTSAQYRDAVYSNAIENYLVDQLTRKSPLFAALGITFTGLIKDVNKDRPIMSRRTFNRIALGGLGAFLGFKVTESVLDSLGFQKLRGIAERISQDNTFVYDEHFEAPWGINERVISAMNKLSELMKLMDKQKIHFEKPVQPVALFGTYHFINEDYLQFGPEAVNNPNPEIIDFLQSGGRQSYWEKWSQQDPRILEALIYDLTHVFIFEKKTDPATQKAVARPFFIPGVGNVLEVH